ncbi:hypothetical protein EJB05_05881, partial [Eragrostis curvula]
GISSANVGDRKTVLLWDDFWGQGVPRVQFPHLHSFTNRPQISLLEASNTEPVHLLFHLPLTVEAYQQYLILAEEINSVHLRNERDVWTYNWSSAIYSSSKAYKQLMGHRHVPAPIKWIWKSSCQMKHRVFFWLLLNDRLNTRGMLRRRSMVLDSYTFIILMAWSIWQTRNNGIFNNIDPTVEGCRQMFKKEMLMVVHRAKQKYFSAITSWI